MIGRQMMPTIRFQLVVSVQAVGVDGNAANPGQRSLRVLEAA